MRMRKEKERINLIEKYVDFERITDSEIIAMKIMMRLIIIGVTLEILSPLIIAIERHY